MSPTLPRRALPKLRPDVPAHDDGGGARVSTLELFFDLVFVFIVTQLTQLVAHAHGPLDFLRAFLVLAVTWWMYGGYAWLTNNVSTAGAAARLLVLAGMAGFLMMALALPHVAGADGIAFGLAYLLVVVVHAAMFMRAPNASARAIFRVAPFNLAAAALVIGAALVPGRWNVVPWIVALLALLAATLVRAERDFPLRAGHFAERHGLIVLIALGESVVGIGTGAGDAPVGWRLVVVAVLGLALAAALWWSYFDCDDARGEHAMARFDGEDRARLGVQAYWFAHLVMIAGIVVAAAGVEGVVGALGAHAEGGASGAVAWLLAAGVATYLTGEAAFRRLLRLGPVGMRAGAAALALGSAGVGRAAGGIAQLAVLVVVLAGMLVLEERWRGE